MKNIVVLVIICLLCSCKENKQNNKIEKEKIQQINVIEEIDNVTLPNKEKYYFAKDIILKKNSKNDLLYMSPKDKIILIMDTNFNIIKHIDLKVNDYMFDSRIQDFEYFNEQIYLGDGFFYIKKYDLATDKIIKLPDYYFVNINNMKDINKETFVGPFPKDLKVYNDQIIIRSSSSVSPKLNINDYKNFKYELTEKFFLGTIINLKEKKIIELLFDTKHLTSEENDYIPYEKAYINLDKDTILVTSTYNKYLYKYQLNGELISKTKFPINKRYFQNPILDKKKKRVTGPFFNYDYLEVFENKYYKLEYRGYDSTTYLKKYDKQLNVVGEYKVNGLKIDGGCVVINNNLYVFSHQPIIYKIDLKNIYE